MRTIVDLSEIERYSICPEQERRRKLDPMEGIDPLERLYQDRMRAVLIRFYGELLGGRLMSEIELRRSWSHMWDTISVEMKTRHPSKAHTSVVHSMMSVEEQMLLRGASMINKLIARKGNSHMSPVIVDEPFSLKLSDELKIVGRYDLVFEDRYKNYWIVDWTRKPGKYDLRFDISHAILIEALYQRTGKRAGLMVDFICTAGDTLVESKRSPQELVKQVKEAAQIARALTADIYYRSVGDHCNQCPYVASCIGVRVIESKKARGRPKQHA